MVRYSIFHTSNVQVSNTIRRGTTHAKALCGITDSGILLRLCGLHSGPPARGGVTMRSYIEPHELNKKKFKAVICCLLIAIAPIVLILTCHLFYSFIMWEWVTLDFSTWVNFARLLFLILNLAAIGVSVAIFLKDLKVLNSEYTTQQPRVP